MSNLKITVLGCGNSTGVPAVGNYWGQCDPAEPKNIRTRSSIAVQSASTTLVIDTGPDFRQQMNRENIENLDAVLYTHHHGDHVSGMDDLRMITFRNKRVTPVYGTSESFEDLTNRFRYLFEGGGDGIYSQIVEPHIIEPVDFGTTQKIGDIEFIPFEQDHGTCKSLGFRFGDFAYSVDMVNLDDQAVNVLKGIKTWIVDAAGYQSSDNPVHASLETIYRLNESIGAEQVYLTSLTLAMDYQRLYEELPEGYEPAYDGLVIQT